MSRVGKMPITVPQAVDVQITADQIIVKGANGSLALANNPKVVIRKEGNVVSVAPADDTVEAWGRAADNPVGGWYGLKKGMRGRFGMYVPPLLEHLGLAEVEHHPRNNRMRAR